MIVPRFWAEASIKDKVNSRNVTVKRFGWSDQSQENAQEKAEQRARDALQRLISGEAIDRREPKVAYNGAEGVPIREEIVSTVGDTIITRNLYGARCLNTPDVLFADIDYTVNSSMRLWLATMVLLFAAVFGLMRSVDISLAWSISGGLVLTMLAGNPLAYWLEGFLMRLRGGHEQHALARIRAWLNSHMDWNLCVYRTPAGLRVLVLHKIFDPTETLVAEFFAALGTDPMYQRMCLNQRCFRARVSAKPWRIGMESHLKPRPGVWPIHPDKIPQRREWVDKYEQLAVPFAACEFLEELGSGVDHPKTSEVRSLHDQLCRVGNQLPLA